MPKRLSHFENRNLGFVSAYAIPGSRLEALILKDMESLSDKERKAVEKELKRRGKKVPRRAG